MNFVTRQMEAVKALTSLNRDAAEQWLSLDADGFERYLKLNARYFGALPEAKGWSGMYGVHRDYVVSLLQGVRDDLEHRSAILSTLAERSASTVQVGFAEAQANTNTHQASPGTPVPDAHESDDLERINGIGAVFAAQLRESGVTSFADLIALETAALEHESHPLHSLKGRMESEEWLEQAQSLMIR